jgi:hypothetical protein
MTERKYCEMVANVFWKSEVSNYNSCMMQAEEALEKIKESKMNEETEIKLRRLLADNVLLCKITIDDLKYEIFDLFKETGYNGLQK